MHLVLPVAAEAAFLLTHPTSVQLISGGRATPGFSPTTHWISEPARLWPKRSALDQDLRKNIRLLGAWPSIPRTIFNLAVIHLQAIVEERSNSEVAST